MWKLREPHWLVAKWLGFVETAPQGVLHSRIIIISMRLQLRKTRDEIGGPPVDTEQQGVEAPNPGCEIFVGWGS